MRDDDKVALLQLLFFASVLAIIAVIISGCTVTVRHEYAPILLPPDPSVLDRLDYAVSAPIPS